jgi:hypothetical protein
MYTNERIRMYGKQLRVIEILCDPFYMDTFEPCHPNYTAIGWARQIPFGKGKTYADEEGVVIDGRVWTL